MTKTVLHHRRLTKSSVNNNDDDDDERQNLLEKTQRSQDEDRWNATNEKFHQFDHIPWKGILLALTLTLIGSVIVIVFICSNFGWIAFKPDDNFTFLTLAFITLVPGLYHCMIAFRAYRGYDGYSFDDIADLN
ncbi:hypothetical protein DERF_006041 [Dermatophagoides farinae]|uniref:Transmembrane protein 230 n=2 Tax=Dermatophagoides farinae TaxID=6954 RepID=A0A922LBU7_DERFA|nr:hypothetical protein HUG17_3111 [Dermatophagoides farinae]KAH9522475.1 hypothetical protein DERF_006041 [Dermatophagoides farinae]